MIRKLFLPGLFSTGAVDDGVMAIRDGIVNFFVVKGPAGLICFDAGWRPARTARAFEALGLAVAQVVGVFLTHSHWDHSGGISLFSHAEVFAGANAAIRKGARRSWTKMKDGQSANIAGLNVRTIETPGHTPDSVSYAVDDRFLFTGDALRLCGGKVMPFPAIFNKDGQALKNSIGKLAQTGGEFDRLLTAHSGGAKDLDHAFSAWRDLKKAGS